MLIEVLLGHRNLPATMPVSATRQAVEAGTLDPALVLIDARRQATGRLAPVVPIRALARFDRPALQAAPLRRDHEPAPVEWGTVFPDPRLVAAFLDRVTFNAHILETGGFETSADKRHYVK